jgi:hypothetical protein
MGNTPGAGKSIPPTEDAGGAMRVAGCKAENEFLPWPEGDPAGKQR